MTSDISDLFEDKGWHQTATLQRFKTFQFEPTDNVATFALRLIKLDIPKEVHMQVTPKRVEQEVEVYFSYDPSFENEVKMLLLAIEFEYKEFMNDDT